MGWLPKSAGADGGYRLGAWYDNVGGNDLYLNTDGAPLATEGGTPLQRHHQSGYYAMAQQRVWSSHGSDTRGLSFFANFVQADRRIAHPGAVSRRARSLGQRPRTGRHKA